MHPSVSGFSGTGVPEDEGQHLQNLYPAAKEHGGWGRFAFDERAHLTENDRSLIEACKLGLRNCWVPYWDLSKPVFIEKSPPNLIRSRFLQAVFPDAKFIFIVRHPLAVSAVTRKWTKQPMSELVEHWIKAHQIFLNDLAYLKNWAWFRYEDLTADSEDTLTDLFRFASLPLISNRRLLMNRNAPPFEKFRGYVERPLRKLLRFTGLSRKPSKEYIEDSNSKYLSQIGEISNSIDIASLELVGRFGYSLDGSYYKIAPGTGRVISSVIDSPASPLRTKSEVHKPRHATTH